MAHFNDLYRAVVEGAGRKQNVGDAVISASAANQGVTTPLEPPSSAGEGGMNPVGPAATTAGSTGGKDHSPSSTLTNEDERPQRL
jgi:hypothetical protein